MIPWPISPSFSFSSVRKWSKRSMIDHSNSSFMPSIIINLFCSVLSKIYFKKTVKVGNNGRNLSVVSLTNHFPLAFAPYPVELVLDQATCLSHNPLEAKHISLCRISGDEMLDNSSHRKTWDHTYHTADSYSSTPEHHWGNTWLVLAHSADHHRATVYCFRLNTEQTCLLMLASTPNPWLLSLALQRNICLNQSQWERKPNSLMSRVFVHASVHCTSVCVCVCVWRWPCITRGWRRLAR